MERPIFWYGSILRSLDLLNYGQKTMVALAQLAEAVLGRGVSTVGLAVTPGTGLTVSVAPGQLYQLEFLEATAISDLPANTTNLIVKQGLWLDAQAVSGFTAPVTVGQSINYLLEAQYADVDTGSVILGYYDSANPSIQYTGPANSGGANTTIRKGAISFQVKAGTPATTGSQTTPSTDAGWTALAVVTVAQGQTIINSGNITAPALAVPSVPITLPAIPAAVQGGTWVSYPDIGTTNAIVIAPVPPISAYTQGMQFRVGIANTNSSSTTFNAGPGPIPALRNNGGTAQAGDFVLGMETVITIDAGGNAQFVPSPNAWAASSVDTGSAFKFETGWVQ